MNRLRVLFVGDVVGLPGRSMFQKHIDKIRTKYKIDAVIVNGENSSNRGRGITSRIVKFFKHNNVDIVTSGNHIWDNKEIYSYLDENTDLLRPANYPRTVPGTGVTTFNCKGYTIGVINVQGRIFMREDLDCPFRSVESLLTFLKDKTNIIFVDFHAEATSEKISLGHFLDGKVSGVVGTHTHVQTADEKILPEGTAYISDLGMVGAYHSSIGMKKESVLYRFLNQIPSRFVVETEGPMIFCGVWIEVDTSTGKAVKIDRVQIIDEDLYIDQALKD